MKNLIKRGLRWLLRIMWIFPVDKRKVIFMCFDGRVCGFDSKAMAKYLIENHAGEYKIYWLTKKRGKLEGALPGIHLIKQMSIAGLYHVITAGSYIFDIAPLSYIPYRNDQVLVNTWHGYPYKKVGQHVRKLDFYQQNAATCYLSYSKDYSELVIRDAFGYNGLILESGVPRNDVFFNDDLIAKGFEIKKNLGLSLQQKIVLYAPTFRGEFNQGDTQLDINRLKEALSQRFGGEWVVLARLHPLIIDRLGFKGKSFINVSDYPDMQDLLVAADVLVTDYSGSQWDFSFTKRPIFLFVPDLEDYSASRGLYYSVEDLPFSSAVDNNALADIIVHFDEGLYVSGVEDYHARMGSFERGTACESVLNFIKTHHGI